MYVLYFNIIKIKMEKKNTNMWGFVQCLCSGFSPCLWGGVVLWAESHVRGRVQSAGSASSLSRNGHPSRMRNRMRTLAYSRPRPLPSYPAMAQLLENVPGHKLSFEISTCTLATDQNCLQPWTLSNRWTSPGCWWFFRWNDLSDIPKVSFSSLLDG